MSLTTAAPSTDRTRRPSALQLGALIASVVIALVVGIWSYFLPKEFFDHFPALLGEWISKDGPYNEHLVRDHGAMYLALGLAGVAGLARPSVVGMRLLGVAWTVFGVLHFAYHVTHLTHLSASEAVAQVVVLAVAALLGAALLVPGGGRRPRA